jgi:citrate/tricarballylate utilization protein
VFPAIEIRREFHKGDVFFLANLCHDCRACYYACMYSPPHEFAIDLPQIMSEARLESYKAWSWPSFLGLFFTDRRIGAALASFAVALVLVLSMVFAGLNRVFALHRGPGAFYQVIPYPAMLVPALALGFYGAAVWVAGGARFWIDTGRQLRKQGCFRALAHAAGDVLKLRWLKGGGPGCYYPGARTSPFRRVYHSLVFYGFLSALVSTTLAAIYQDLLHRLPPYSLTSAPVIFGTIGGIGMMVGVAGLISMKLKSDQTPAGARALSSDYLFLVILGLTSLSGMLTLASRTTRAMGFILTIHLGLIAALFITMPYGKFVHSVYRSLAIIRHRIEQLQSGANLTKR